MTSALTGFTEQKKVALAFDSLDRLSFLVIRTYVIKENVLLYFVRHLNNNNRPQTIPSLGSVLI